MQGVLKQNYWHFGELHSIQADIIVCENMTCIIIVVVSLLLKFISYIKIDNLAG